MNDSHLYNVLANALGTIEMQRQEIAVLRPAADGYRRLSQMLDLARCDNRPEQAYGVDVQWELKQAMEEIHASMSAAKSQAHRAAGAKPADYGDLRSAFAQAKAGRKPNAYAAGEPHDEERREATGEDIFDPDNPDLRPDIELEIDRVEKAQRLYDATEHPPGTAAIDLSGRGFASAQDRQRVEPIAERDV